MLRLLPTIASLLAMFNIGHRSTSGGFALSAAGRSNITPTSLKSDRAAKSAAPGPKTAPGGSKTLPGASLRPPQASPRSPAGPKIRPQTSPASPRRPFSRSPEPFSASPRAPRSHPARLKSAPGSSSTDREASVIDHATRTNHAPSPSADDDANSHARAAHHADDAAND